MDNPAAAESSTQESLVDSFSSLFSDESPEESGAQQASQQTEESPEAAAERLLAEEAAAANQNNAEDGENKQDQAEPDTFTIEVDGKSVQMTKAEIAEHYKNGLRQKDYTQKTMEVSEQRKAADAEIAKTRAERDNYAQQLNNFAITSESILAEQAKALTEDLLRSDPVEYMALERTFRERQANLAKAQSELQRINGERQQEQQQSVQEFIKSQQEKLFEALPELKDDAKRKQVMGELETFMESNGFTKNDGLMVLDARILTMARKAQQYDALLARAKNTQAVVSKAPQRVERPGTTPVHASDGRSSVAQKFMKSGSRADAAAYFGELFG